jgi:hypothetical protein
VLAPLRHVQPPASQHGNLHADIRRHADPHDQTGKSITICEH